MRAEGARSLVESFLGEKEISRECVSCEKRGMTRGSNYASVEKEGGRKKFPSVKDGGQER